MKKKNVIDMETYRVEHEPQPLSSEAPTPPPMSEELKEAIESLINKLRTPETTNEE
jgi:hypothetical protein